MEGKGLDAVITGFEKRLAHRRAKPTTKSGELFYEIMLDYFNRARRAKEEEKYLAWVGLFAPVELMYAMDIVPFIPEHFGILMSSQMDFTPYYEAASAYGLPRELCSSHRAMTGLAIKRELPSPDCIVSTSQSCDTTIKSFECLGNLYESPAFFLDFPYKDTEEALRYYEGEITELISFLEEQTRKNLDIDKLKETIQLSKQLDDLLFDVGELKKAVPAPMKGRDSFRHLGISLTMAGSQRGVDYFQTLRDELKETVQSGKGAVPGERHRILWLYVPIMFDMKLYDWMEKDYGAVVVMDSMDYISDERLDPSDPIRFLAKRAYNQWLVAQYCRPIRNFDQDAVKMAVDYKVDACIYQAFIGCKHGCAVIRMVKDTLREECGVPTLILDGDGFDPTVVSSDEMKEAMEGFFEMLDAGA